MKSTYVIDANVVLRYLLGDHPTHSPAATELMEAVRKGTERAYVPEGVLVECVYVLLKVYKVPRAEIADKLAGVLRFQGIVNSDRGQLVQALHTFAKRNVDIVDAIVHACAAAHGWTPFSFDKDVRKLQE